MTAARLLPLWIAGQVRNDGHPLVPVSRTGSPSPLIPLPSRDLCKTYRHSPRKRESTGKRNLRERPSACIIAVLLSFAKVSIKGEGDDAGHRFMDFRFRGE